MSPDGRWLYLIQYTSPDDPLQYRVRALDSRSGRLDPKPIVDPREPGEAMNGHPLTRATSPDGRWAYTLYDGTEHPFVHALDTANRSARCIDLDWLHGRKDLWAMRFAVSPDGGELRVHSGEKTVALVDTGTWAAATGAERDDGWSPWVYVLPRRRAARRVRAGRAAARLLHELRRRDLDVGVLEDPRELVPVKLAVEAQAEPAAVPDVRRAEEALGVGLDQHLLDAVLGRRPQREPPVAVVVVQDHREGALVPDEEGRVTVAQPLARLRQGEAELADAFEDLVVLSHVRTWRTRRARCGLQARPRRRRRHGRSRSARWRRSFRPASRRGPCRAARC